MKKLWRVLLSPKRRRLSSTLPLLFLKHSNSSRTPNSTLRLRLRLHPLIPSLLPPPKLIHPDRLIVQMLLFHHHRLRPLLQLIEMLYLLAIDRNQKISCTHWKIVGYIKVAFLVICPWYTNMDYNNKSTTTTYLVYSYKWSLGRKGNPLLKHIRNVRWTFADIVCDYLLGPNTCALYLSLRYHLLHPDYLYFRIRELQKNFRLRIILCHVDVEDVIKPLLEVTRTSLLHDCTLLCGWSLEECGRYLETVKVYENKPADLIQGQMDGDYLSRLNHALTAIRHVNKTDVVTLGSTFGSLSHVMDASMEDLARCPGIGERKVKRLYDAFHEPFKREVPKRQCIPETSVANESHPGSSNTKEDEKEIVDTSNSEKKEPEVTVKSALSAAFAKYSHKITRKKTNKSQEEEEGKCSTNEEAKTGDTNGSNNC